MLLQHLEQQSPVALLPCLIRTNDGMGEIGTNELKYNAIRECTDPCMQIMSHEYKFTNVSKI